MNDGVQQMATKKLKLTPIAKVFGAEQISAHVMGQNYRDLFIEAVDNFFTRMNHHLYIAGQPGVGKTYTVEALAENYPKIYLLTLKGQMKVWAFIKTIAVNLYKLPKGMKLVVYIDDFNHMFKASSEFLDIFKIAMDKVSGDCLEYNTSLGAQYAGCEDFEKEAIDYWKSLDPDRTGFRIPFDGRVKFIFTMNTPLPGKQEMDKLEVGSDKWIKLNNRAAIRSRTTYEDLVMDKKTYWGWICEVVWNNPTTMCVGATEDQRYEMMTWLWDNWDVASETSLRFVEEQMWEIMKNHPTKSAYRTRWEKLKG
jgi:hypothetical protein